MDTRRHEGSPKSRWDVLAVGALGGALLATGLVYDRLPDPMATHFDLHGNPNGWMSRPWGAWFVPALALGLWALVRLLPAVLPRTEKKRLASSAAVPLVAALVAVFMAMVHLVILRVALVPGASVNRPVFLAIGALYVGLGLVMPRVKRNGLVGVRTPWTLGSDENWARTHRVAGYTMVVTGFLAGAAGAFGSATGAGLAIAFLLVGGLVPAVYSLVLARRLDSRS